MAGLYNRGKFLLAGGSATPVDWDTSDLRMALVTATYTFSAAHNFLSEVTANELTGGTYPTGATRKATTRTVVEADGSNRAELTIANAVFSGLSATGTPAAAVIFRETASSPTDANRELISYHEFTATPTNGGDFTVSFASLNAVFLT